MNASPPRKPQGATEGSRVHRSALDDADIFRELYQKLLAYAAIVADAGIEPADLVQDALVATLRSHRLVELDYPQAYLRRAVLSAAVGKQRKAASFRKYAPELIDDTTKAPSYPSDLADLEHLDPRDRAILYLVYVEGCSYSEVAEATGESVNNARRRASEARKQLKEAMTEEAAAMDKETER